MNYSHSLSLSVVCGDALKFRADVLVLKYAQGRFGLDEAVYSKLVSNGISPELPSVNNFTLVDTNRTLAPKHVLFVGVKPLLEFRYPEIRDFARTALISLSHEAPTVRHVTFSIHGPGYGLDEIEAFKSQVAGIVDSVTAGECPQFLESITFVERAKERASRLAAAFDEMLPTGALPFDGHGSIAKLTDETRNTLRTVGYSSAAKPHVFVAMPFASEMEDVFYYGIQGAINGAGFLCERVDLTAFTGDVMERVRNRIATAKLVVADLSSANPNVYLEVGYAWGRQIPTVLLAKEANDLKFDVKGQRCIIYTSIRHLEESLQRELQGLKL